MSKYLYNRIRELNGIIADAMRKRQRVYDKLKKNEEKAKITAISKPEPPEPVIDNGLKRG